MNEECKYCGCKEDCEEDCPSQLDFADLIQLVQQHNSAAEKAFKEIQASFRYVKSKVSFIERKIEDAFLSRKKYP